MTNELKRLVHDGIAFCGREVEKLLNTSTVSEALSLWLLPSRSTAERARSLRAQAIASSGAQRTYREIAIVGYCSAVLGDNEGASRFSENLMWLIGRKIHVEGELADFCTDGVALLGIALGARQLAPAQLPELARWLSEVERTASNPDGLEPWNSDLITAARDIANADQVNQMVAAEIYLSFYRKGIIISEPQSSVTSKMIEKLLNLSNVESERAAFFLCAYEEIAKQAAQASLSRPSVKEVADLLRSVPGALRRWTWEDKPKTTTSDALKWDIQNEYHVQNLLWMILSPLFPDAKDEQYSHSVGPVQPRVDIEIPSLRLVIEIKFLRSAKSPQDMVNEIAQDCSLYLAEGSPHRYIVPFIWDDSRRNQFHSQLITGLKKLSGVADAIVVSRPGNMDYARNDTKAKVKNSRKGPAREPQ